MPVINDYIKGYEAPESMRLSKYMDPLKFINFLVTSNLYMHRIDKLEDAFEGTYPDSQKDLDNMFTKAAKLTRRASVSCSWQMGLDESVAMWKIYSSGFNGIMIRTTVKNLKESLINFKGKLYLAKVTYLDSPKAIIPDINSIMSLIYKQKFYQYENEVRLVHELIEIPLDYHTDYKSVVDSVNNLMEDGKSIPIDLNKLIIEIVVGPKCPNWVMETIKLLLLKLQLNIPIVYSEIKIN